MAEEAGFDMIEIEMAHVGADADGGTLEKRMRYPLEMLEAVRDAWPKDRPLAARLSAADGIADGFAPGDAVTFARAMKDRGCDIVAVNQTWLSDQIRNEARIPTIVAEGITSADQVNTLLLAGRADLCALVPRFS